MHCLQIHLVRFSQCFGYIKNHNTSSMVVVNIRLYVLLQCKQARLVCLLNKRENEDEG